MSDSAEQNPYAPPTEAEAPARKGRRKKRVSGAVEEALAALDEHLSDPTAVRADAKEAGPRIRTVTVVFCVLATAGILGSVMTSSREPFFPFVVMVAVLCGIFGGLLLIFDLTLVPFGQPTAPEKTLESFYKAIARNRLGYAWALLCPTAREQTVQTPELTITTKPGEFSVQSPQEMKRYLESFARPGGGQVRTLGVKRATVYEVQDDVAVVDAALTFQSWPSWVSGIIAASFIIFRPLAIIGIILMFALRKKQDVHVRKTMLRGKNGTWYVLDADLVERASD